MMNMIMCNFTMFLFQSAFLKKTLGQKSQLCDTEKLLFSKANIVPVISNIPKSISVDSINKCLRIFQHMCHMYLSHMVSSC